MRRIPLLVAGIALVAVAIFVFALLRTGSDDDRRFAPAAGEGPERYDPLAYDDERRAEFERRAAAGLADVIYEKSPGGVVASARRTARWRPLVERAAAGSETDPDVLEAIVLLESAGRPDAIAGDDPEAASGLTQILAGTATDLLGMSVDLERSRALTRRIRAAEARGDGEAADRLRVRRRRIDDRFHPAEALRGAVRYLAFARERLGRDDLAVVSYHMGVGNLEGALRAYADEPDAPIAEVVEDAELSYARLYFDTTPLHNPRAYARLATLGDDSATYYWRVLAAREVMRLYREAPGELRRLAELHAAADSSARVLHPPGSTTSAANAEEVARTLADGEATARFGLAFAGGATPALRGEALSALLWIGAATRDVTGGGELRVVATTTGDAPASEPLHETGWAFDVARDYESRRQALAFEFALDRMAALRLIAWRRGGDRIHVVVAPDAGRWLPAPDELVRDREPVEAPAAGGATE